MMTSCSCLLLYSSVNLALDYEPLPGILTQIIVPQINGAGKKTCATGKSGTLVNFKKGSRGVVILFNSYSEFFLLKTR